MEYAVSMEGICKSFSNVQVLDHVDFHLRPGEIHAIVGENGAGKSTLIKILSGALDRDGGTIRVEGREAEIHSPTDAQKLGIQCIYQELSLIPHLSVADNIFLTREQSRAGMIRQRQINRQARELMAFLNLEIDVKTEVRHLGIGQQFFTEICRCMVGEARVVIMDEPTSAMTPVEYEHFLKTVRQLRHRNISVIYISHHLDEIFEICDSVTILRDGRLIDSRRVEDITLEEMVRLMIGKEMSGHLTRIADRDFSQAPVVLEMREVSTARLREVSLQLRRGEVLGVTGLLGSGKTEIARALFGADSLTGGSILLEGKPVRLRHTLDAMDYKIALVPEDRKRTGLFQEFSIRENISVVNLTAMERLRYFINRTGEQDFADRAVKDFRVKCKSVSQRVKFLSGGNQQKVALAKWMAREPRVLLLDEPTRGIDVGSKEEIYQMIRGLSESGISVILFSSEMQEVISLSHRVAVLHEGRVRGILDAREATQERILLMAAGE